MSLRTVSKNRLFEYQGVGSAIINPAVCVRNSADYSPFGVSLDGRTIQTDFYRRGFNGMELDDEMKGKGNSYDFGARMYDSRVGRWWSCDFMSSKKPYLSSYQSFRNNPLFLKDPDGNDEIITIIIKQEGKPDLIIKSAGSVNQNVRAGGCYWLDTQKGIRAQHFYDFNTVYTFTLSENKFSLTDIKRYTLTDRRRYTETFTFSSSYEGGEIFNPYEQKWNLEGKGGSQKGGWNFYTNEGGASPTKQRALNSVQSTNLTLFLATWGAMKIGSWGTAEADKMSDFIGFVKDASNLDEDLEANAQYRKKNEPKEVKDAIYSEAGTGFSNRNVMSSNNYWVYPEGTPDNLAIGRIATIQERINGDTLGGNNKPKEIYPKKPNHEKN